MTRGLGKLTTLILAFAVTAGTIIAISSLSAGRLLLLGVGAIAVAALVTLVTGKLQTEKTIAGYWTAFCLFSTLLVQQVIGGMFAVFYVAIVVGAVYRLATSSVRLDRTLLILFGCYFLVLLGSLFEFAGSSNAIAIDRLLAVLIAALTMFLISDRAGARLVQGSMVLSSAIIAAWVVISAAQSEFSYRGNVNVNENVVSLYVGFGFMLTIGYLLGGVGRHSRRGWLKLTGLALVTVLMGYSLAILASRGMMIAVLLAIGFAFVAALFSRKLSLKAFVIIPIALSIAMLLPGSSGIIERFNSPSTESGGGRTLIWDVTLDSTISGNLRQILIGHGMDSSASVIRQEFSYVSSTHSSFLYILFNHGILGLLVFVAIHVVLFDRLWRLRDPSSMPLLMVLVFQVAAGLFLTTSDNYMYWTSLGIMSGHIALLGGESRGYAHTTAAGIITPGGE